MQPQKKAKKGGRQSKSASKKAVKSSQNSPTTHSSHIIQRATNDPHSLTADDILQLQRLIGNRAATKLIRPHQSKNQPIVQRTISTDSSTGRTSFRALTYSGESKEKDLAEYLNNSTSPTFTFPSYVEAKKFVKRYAHMYSYKKDLFTETETAKAIKPIASARRTGFTNKKGVMESEITVCMVGGSTLIVRPFASKNRHLFSSFKKSQFRPRAAKESNTIVKWHFRFKEKFLDYTDLLAQKIVANKMLMGYEPTLTGHNDPQVRFDSDQPELPNNSYDRINAVHSFPAEGTDLVSLEQEQFDKINIIISHVYEVDNYGILRETNATSLKPNIPTDPIILENTRKKETDIKSNLITLNQYGLPLTRPKVIKGLAEKLKLGWLDARDTATGNIKHYNPEIKSAIEQLHRLLVTYNVRTEIDPSIKGLYPSASEAVKAYGELDKNGKKAIKWLEPTIEKKINSLKSTNKKKKKKNDNLKQKIAGLKKERFTSLVDYKNMDNTLTNFYDLYELAKQVKQKDTESTLPTSVLDLL